MVKLSSLLFILSSLLATVFAAPNFKRDVKQVVGDLTIASRQTTALNTAVVDFTGTFAEFLLIQFQVGNLGQTLDQARNDVGTAVVAEDDGKTVLTKVQGIEPIILEVLTNIVIEKPKFEAVPDVDVVPLVKQSLINLGENTVALANALIETAPPDLVPQATAIKTTLGDAFSTAVTAFT